MVKGLDKFKDYFKDYADHYTIIGGTACNLIIGTAGFKPRATRDIDIILIVEALSKEFVGQFWNFVKEGQYERKEKSEDNRKYYRFLNPANEEFPYQLELFSRMPDLLNGEDNIRFTSIPIDDDQSSLSAILMNDDYYNYTLDHSTKEEEIQRANIEALICLKARAYLDMVERKSKGEKVNDKDIKKHKADVFRLGAMLAGNEIFELPETIHSDVRTFILAVKDALPDKAIFKEMGLGNIEPSALYKQLIENFQIKLTSALQ